MARPRYALIADWLRQQIRTGDLAAHAKIPSLPQLAAQFDVSEIVARQAIRTLVTEGLLQTKPGSGTFVTEHSPLVRLAPHRYRRARGATTYVEEAARAGVEVEVEHATAQVPAVDHVADTLGIAVGAAVSQTDYLVRMGGVPVSMSCTWEPLVLTAGTDIEWPDDGPYGHLGIIDRFAVIGVTIDEVEEILTFRSPTEEEAGRLEQPAGMWVIAIDQRFHAETGTVAASAITYRPDRYQFLYRFPVPPADPSFEYDPGDEIGPLGGLL